MLEFAQKQLGSISSRTKKMAKEFFEKVATSTTYDGPNCDGHTLPGAVDRSRYVSASGFSVKRFDIVGW